MFYKNHKFSPLTEQCSDHKMRMITIFVFQIGGNHMYQRSPMTERVQAIREKCRSTKPAIDISRYRLVTEC